ncbi:rod shape-determining protein MreC [Candidatus Latescibacterota bacterium]
MAAFQRNRDYIAIGLALIVSLTLTGLPPGQQEVVAARCRAAFWSTGQWLFSRVIRYATSEQKTRYLLTQNVELALENMRLREAAQENRRLRRALEFRARDRGQRIIPAEVIGRDPDQMHDALVVDVGADMEIERDWPVVTTAGLVGHVIQVEGSSSVVQLIMQSHVSAVVQEGRAHGMVSWVPGNRFQLRYADANSVIETGDRVVTSGLGGRYPKGLTVGYVTEVREQQRDPLFMEVFLESSVDFWDLEEVFVLDPTAR